MSIVYLSWADPTASVCGRLWGKYTPRYGGKTLAGSLGAFFAGMLVTILFNSPWSHFSLSYRSDSSPVPLTLLSIYGGLVASFSEGISDLAFGLDDNLTIPVLSATLMWIPLVYFGLGV
jgi:diacylglycerol kinase (CTP)